MVKVGKPSARHKDERCHILAQVGDKPVFNFELLSKEYMGLY
jgi:hypothetical protein